MSCPAEERLSIYVDGELEPGERRALEAHLVRCERCRGRVLSLRREAELLRDALLGRARTPARARPSGAPGRGLALGAVPAIAAAALATVALGWLADVPFLPMSPFRLVGVFDMGFDLVFMLRDRAPEIFSLGVALAVLGSASALLSVVLPAVLRRLIGLRGAALALLALVVAPAPGQAHFGLHRHDDFALPAGETHAGTLVVSGNAVDVDGTVDGDLVVMAERLALRGEVRGNVFALARSVEVDGDVRGALLCTCARIYLRGGIQSDVYAMAEDLSLAADGRIGRNLTAVTERTVVEGEVGRDLATLGERAELRGRIGGDLHAWGARVLLRDGSRVEGDVTAYVEEEADGEAVDVAAGAVVGGEVTKLPTPWPREAPLARYRKPGFYLLHAVLLAGALLVGTALHALLPALFDARLETTGAFFRTLGVGLLTAVAAPIGLALLGFTLVGLPLALIGFGLYLFALYAGVIAVAALVGRTLVTAEHGDTRRFALALLAGLAVVTVVTHLPYVGPPASAIAIATGLGLLVARALDAWRARAAFV